MSVLPEDGYKKQWKHFAVFSDMWISEFVVKFVGNKSIYVNSVLCQNVISVDKYVRHVDK